MLPEEQVVTEAKYNDDKGMLRFSIVTSGKALSDAEVDQVCDCTVPFIGKQESIPALLMACWTMNSSVN